MGIKVQRNTQKIGHTRVVSLPAPWCHYYGDRINRVTIIGGTLLIVAPVGFEELAERVADHIEQTAGLESVIS